MRRAARRDDNEDPLLDLARRLGASWVQEGPLDGWIYWRGGWVPTEIKRPDKEGHVDEFTMAQLEFIGRCRLIGAPFFIWRTEMDVLASLRAKVAA